MKAVIGIKEDIKFLTASNKELEERLKYILEEYNCDSDDDSQDECDPNAGFQLVKQVSDNRVLKLPKSLNVINATMSAKQLCLLEII